METKVKTQSQSKCHHGYAIKRLRQGELLTQRQLGDLVGMTQQAIYRYEKEEKLDDDVLQPIAKALGVSVDFIKEMEEDRGLVYYIENNTISSPASSNNSLVNNGSQITNTVESDILKTTLEELKKSSDACRRQCETMTDAYKQMLEFYKEEIQELKRQLSVRGETNHAS